MTELRIFITLALLIFSALADQPALADDQTRSPAAQAFEHFKKLEGTWTGQSESGRSFEMTFRLTGDGSAVIEHSRMDGAHDMFTVYHLDQETIMLTHYCASGNQPRMRAADFSSAEIRFDFLDATGLATAGDGHMYRATFAFEDPDRFHTAWTWRENGADVFTEVVAARRTGLARASR